MPETAVYFYKDDGGVPVGEWLKDVRKRDRKAYANCRAAIEMLALFGHELRRPYADILRDGIYELRVRARRVQYRILYFFDGKDVVVLTHGLTKEKKVPVVDIDRAIQRKERYKQDPEEHRTDEVNLDD